MDFLQAKDIKGYEGLYSICPNGDVYSYPNKSNHKSKKKIKGFVMDNGYVYVYLYKNSERKIYKVHRLVAETFLPNPENKPQVNHKNGIKTDNRLENLEWNTQSENQKHSFKIGLNRGNYGITNGMHRSIEQYDKNGKYIISWETMTAASNSLNINISNICNCCAGKIKSIGGFIFKYAKEKK